MPDPVLRIKVGKNDWIKYYYNIEDADLQVKSSDSKGEEI